MVRKLWAVKSVCQKCTRLADLPSRRILLHDLLLVVVHLDQKHLRHHLGSYLHRSPCCHDDTAQGMLDCLSRFARYRVDRRGTDDA